VTDLVAWLAEAPGPEALGALAGHDRDLLGPLPDRVKLVPEPTPEVRFAVPAWGVAPVLSGLPALEVVQVLSAGVDWIVDDIPDGVTLCSARGTRDGAMAEWVVAALLADLKRLGPFSRARTWERQEIYDLARRRVMILGHGSIGHATERLLAPFGCEVVGVARRARPGMLALSEARAVLGAMDAVVNLLPLTPATRGLVDAEFLAAMPDGALYVNAGRGATTDTAALTAEVERGRLRAVLDVVDPEPLPDDHPLWRLPGAVVSPHVAGDTPGGDRAAWELVGDQLRRLAAGEPLVNVVVDGY
jgi:phosphoglycerate dehydrogenase-like enzyme